MFVELFIFGFVLVASFIFIGLWNCKRKKSKSGHPYPPSLPSLPLVGSLPFMRDFANLPDFFLKQTDRLGPIFTIKVGSKLTLLLNSREVINEAFIKHSASFSDREDFYIEKYVILNTNKKGILFKNFTAEYKKYHHISLTILKQFGFGTKNLMEFMIQREAAAMVGYIQQLCGKSFDPDEVAFLCSSNIISSLVFGYRREYAIGMNEISFCLSKIVHLIDQELELAPILRFLPHYRRRHRAMAQYNVKCFQNIEDEIKRCSTEEGEDCFIRRYLEKEGPGYDPEQLKFTIRDLMGAGTDTTATTLRWAIVLLANHPNVQKRLQEEIDAAITGDVLPSIDDMSRLPYLKAAILEVMRIRTLVPLAIPHMTLTNAIVAGFFIPAGTMVLPNLHAVHMDPNVWEDPDVFRPERFLDKDNHLVGHERVIPFSVGRRSCLGEVLARQEVFLFVAGLVQNFTIKPPEGQDEIVVGKHTGVTMAPTPFQVRMIARNHE